MKKEVILGSAYLGPVEYYTKLFAYDTVRVERYDHYMKQTYRNPLRDSRDREDRRPYRCP